MTATRPAALPRTTSEAPLYAPAPAATDLAHAMLDNGWILTGATVQVVHTAHLADSSGLTIRVSSEAGRVRLGFDSEYRCLDGSSPRLPWHAEASHELSVEVLAAVTSANTVSSDEDPTAVGETLIAAGWSQPCPSDQRWLSPDEDREVMFLDEEYCDTQLPWLVHCEAARPVAIHASCGTPAAVIVAFALTHGDVR